MTGFITLFGVAVRNGLLLVDNCDRKFAERMLLQQAVVEGALERVNAILQPLAIASQVSVGIVVLGGLFTSTALTLLVISALYAKFGKWLTPRLNQGQKI